MRFEPDADSLQRLRETLAHLFPSAADTQMVLRDIDLTPERVDDTGSAEVRWFHAVAETVKQGRLRALVTRARETYRDDEVLVAVEQKLGPEPRRDDDRLFAMKSSTWEGALAEVVPWIELRERGQKRHAMVARAELSPFHEVVEVTWAHDQELGAYLVGALREAPDRDALDRFAARCGEWKRSHPRAGWSWLVYLGEPCEQALRSRAAEHDIELRCLAEYASGLIDFRGYVRAQNARLASDRQYRPDQYIDARITRLKLGADETFPVAIKQVREWMRTPEARLIVLLGDFGAGKSFLLREIARRLGDERTNGGHTPVPLLIEVRDFHKAPTLKGLLAVHLGDHDVDYRYEALRHMIREGQVVLLFDGFDELAQRLDFDHAADHLRTIVEAVDGRAKVLLTSRKQHFHSDAQVRSALVETVERVPFVMARLEPFNREEIRAFLALRLDEPGDGDVVNERMGLLDQVHDLAGLGQNPRMLSFIADLGVAQLREAAEGGEITSARLYELLVAQWLKHERERKDLPGSRRGLSDAQLTAVVERLALRLWGQVERFVSRHELEAVVCEVLAALPAPPHEPGVATHQIGSASLLTRDGEDRFTFFHQSVMEWLIARQIARDWTQGRPSPVVTRHPFTNLTPKFLVEMVGEEVATREAQTLSGDEQATARENATRIMTWVRRPTSVRLDLHGQDLRAQDLSAFLDRLQGADLSGCDLTGVRLRGIKAQGVSLRRARLRDADLTKADLRDADFRDADLTGAKLTGATLTGAHFEGATLARVSLVGAVVEPAVEARVVTTGGAPANVTRAVPRQLWGVIYAVAIDPTGSTLALASGSQVWLIDLETLVVFGVLRGHQANVVGVAFSPDGTLLATGSEDQTARLWDVATGQCRTALQGHSNGVSSVAFSSDGTLLATGSLDRTARLWDVATGQCRTALQGHSDWVQSVAFSPDGTLLATGSEDQTARLWDVATGQCRTALQGHSNGVWSVAFSPDGTLLATGSQDRTARLWDVATGQCRTALQGHSDWVQSVAFSPDGTLLATGSEDQTARLWDVATGQCRTALQGHSNKVWSVAFSPDGTLLATGSLDQTARLWNVATGQCRTALQGHSNGVSSVAFSPDGTLLATGSEDQTARLWDVATGQCRTALQGHSNWVLSVAFSPDGTLLTTGSWDQTARLWDVTTGQCHTALQGHSNAVWSVTFSPDGTLLATASEDQTARLWDVATGQCRTALQGHSNRVWGVAFSPDGTLLATASEDQTARLWDVATGQCRTALQGHSNGVLSVAFSPDGTLLATGSRDQTARLWDVATGQCRTALQGHSNWVQSVAFSPDGTLLATGSVDQTARLWDVATGRCRATLRGHIHQVQSVVFSPDGTLLATGSTDGTTRIWSVEDGRCLLILMVIDDAWVIYTPDGRYRHHGDLRGSFWHAVNLCRFDPGELDDYCDLRLPDVASLLPPRRPLVSLPAPRPTSAPPPEEHVAPAPSTSPWPSVIAGVSAGATFAGGSLALGLSPTAAALAGVVAGASAAAIPSVLRRKR